MVLTGGTENMSQTPYAVRNARWGSPLGVDLKVNRITVISENKPTPFFLCKLLEKVISLRSTCTPTYLCCSTCCYVSKSIEEGITEQEEGLTNEGRHHLLKQRKALKCQTLGAAVHVIVHVC